MAIVKPEGSDNDGSKKSPSKGPKAPKTSSPSVSSPSAAARKRTASPSAATTEVVAKPEPALQVEPAPVVKARKPSVSFVDSEMVILDPTREEIAMRAYELYVARGRRDGHSDADWTRAEQELNAERERARRALRQPASRSTTES